MSTLMLTALDEKSSRVLNIVAMTQPELDSVHGRRVAQRHGYDIVCKQCNGPVHLVVNQHHTAYWRHDPGAGRTCLLTQVTTGHESPEHLAAKYAIARALHSLGGWTTEPERRFQRDGDLVIVDVFAEHTNPAIHQPATAWEVQMSPQTRGDFVSRTEQIRRVARLRAAWVTPHDDALAEQLGIIIDPSATHVVDRVYTAPDEAVRVDPIPTGEFVKAVARHRPTLLWAQAGEYRRWIAFPPSAAGTHPTKPKPPRPTPTHRDDRECARDVGFVCSTCGLSDLGREHLRARGFTARPCARCIEHFEA